MEGKKQQRFVFIDGKRYRIKSELNAPILPMSSKDLVRKIKIIELRRDIEKKIKEEMEILGSDHANISTLYVTPEQMVMYADMGLWQCKFCEEGFMGHMDYCPKCGCGPDAKPLLGPTVDMIAAVIGRWIPKKMNEEVKKVLKNQE